MTEIVLGPPGTGKTRTLLTYVERELKRGVPPNQIAYVSFTRRAAQEAVDRACNKFKLKREDLPYFSTLHSLCYRQLGIRRGEVFEGAKVLQFGKFAGVTVTGRSMSEDGVLSGFEIGDRVLFMENLARMRGIPLRRQFDEDCDGLGWMLVEQIVKALMTYKISNGLSDFTDMLTNFLNSGIKLNLNSLFVDEAQDLSHLQWLVIQRLSEGCKRVAVAGDDDQAIYRWAGADVDHLIDMRGEVRVLGQSWRVPPVIQTVANDVIRNVHHRREKKWSARTGDEGVVSYVPSFDEVDVETGSTLVLTRNVYVLREQVIPELRRRGIVFERFGVSSISHMLLEAIKDWERLRKGEKISVSSMRHIYEKMSVTRGFKRGYRLLKDWQDDDIVDMQKMKRDGGLLREDPWFEAMDKLPFTDVEYIRSALKRGEKLLEKPRVVLSTIHGAKGGEADHVVLMKEMAWRTHAEMDRNPEDEARVWYVGVTRARQRLTIVNSQTRRGCPWL